MHQYIKRFFAAALIICIGISAVGCGNGKTSETVSDKESGANTEMTESTASEQPTERETGTKPGSETETGSDQESVTITISPRKASVMNGGKFEGWGTSLCWWANRLGYSDSLAQQSADLFFGKDGLNLNIMRYNIGGGDDPTHDHITRTDSAVPGWMVWDEAQGKFVYDYDADKNQLNVLQRAVKAAGNDAIVEVFSNSPPYFMTVSGCSSGGTDPNVNNLKEDMVADFAEYLAHVTDHIQNKMGIRVSSLSPMNEPDTNFWHANSNKQEGCHFDSGKAQSDIIEKTAEAMKKYDISNVLLVASDETSTAKQIDEYRAYSDAARAALGRINTHTYDASRAAELGRLAKKEGFNLWMSEVDGSGTSGVVAGEMSSALWLGEKIISDIDALSPSAWVMWQVVDNHISKEGYNGKKDKGMVNTGGGFWGVAVADHDEDTIVLTQKYYGFGQFTRYIRPGMTIIHSGGNTLSAYDPAKKELVIVAVNAELKNQPTRFDLSQFGNVDGAVEVVRTSGSAKKGEHWAKLEDLRADGTGFTATLRGNSITTFIVKGVEMACTTE